MIYQTSKSQAVLKANIPTHELGPVNKLCIDTEPFRELLRTKKEKKEVFSKGCGGGTFDYLHSGHKVNDLLIC